MSRIADILREVDTLERVQAELAGIATRTDDARRHALVELRRTLSAQIATVGALADALFAAAATADVQRAYREVFSRMRSRAALHQANWPAVRLGEDVSAYRASAQTVRDANRDFVTWIRTALADPSSFGDDS